MPSIILNSSMAKSNYSPISSTMFLHLLLLALPLLIQITPLQVQAAATVKFLPGFDGPLPFHLETGYVGVGKEEKHQLFYYFIKSESDPGNDPLILWLTGGPGCSSFNGVVYEIGPLYYKQKKYNGSLPTLGVTPNSWTKVANIIFLEQPVNTGFSYATTPEAMHVIDVDACTHVYQFLLKWLVDHPEFSSNNFYLGGDSYSGIVVPRVVQLISDGIEAGNKPLVNLKGYLLGNPLTFPEEKNFMIPFLVGMAIIPIELYQSMMQNCKGEYRKEFAPTNAQCSQDLNIVDELSNNINDQHVLDPLCGSETELKSPFPSKFRGSRRSIQENAISPSCYGKLVDRHELSNYWANDPRVQKALHVRKGTIDHWARCKQNGIKKYYTFTSMDSISYHRNHSAKGYRSLIYSGDHDMGVPFQSTEAWIKSLNYSIVDNWRQWIVNGQVAGYTRSYANKMTYATVKIALDSIDVAIWQMAVEPCSNSHLNQKQSPKHCENGHDNHRNSESSDSDSSESEDGDDSVELHEDHASDNSRIAFACDDGRVRIYVVDDDKNLTFKRSSPSVKGRTLSVTWSSDANRIFSGSSDGVIRCWNAEVTHEIYRISVGLGGLGSGSELCIWSLLALRCGTLVSADSSGSVQFWDTQHGTLVNALSNHKGDVNALAASPSHTRVFSAGSDGQVVLYKLSVDFAGANEGNVTSGVMKKWVYISHVRAHTHDVKALTIAVPISREDTIVERDLKRPRSRSKLLDSSYHKWAHLGVPMLISGGDDTKLFAYSAREFTKFSPHDICPVPQRPHIQLAVNTIFNQAALLLIQASYWIDVLLVRAVSGGAAKTDLVARVKCKAPRKITCSAVSPSGGLFAFSDHVKCCLFELKRIASSKSPWAVNKSHLPLDLPFAHSMVFSADSSRLMIAGCDRRVYVVEAGSSELVHVFTPRREEHVEELLPAEPPITRMFISIDGQWLATINCFGDVYIFNLETQRQHWFISRLGGHSVTAGGFSPQNSNVLIVSTSSNQVYALDVEAKQLGEWSNHNTFALPRRYQEFPGEVIGISFPPSSASSSVIAYSPRAMCLIDFGKPVDGDDEADLANGQDLASKKLYSTLVNGGMKRKLKGSDLETKLNGRKNFEFHAFRDPVLFVGHLSKTSTLIIDKPWIQVVKSFDTTPVHRHIFGT